MGNIIKTLEYLGSVRQRAVEKLIGELGRQKQLCQRYERNVNALTDLFENTTMPIGATAALMRNQSGYKSHIKRVIDWQKQEQTLANKQTEQLKSKLITEARRGKTLEMVLLKQRKKQAAQIERKEQKKTDTLSTQSWLRKHRSSY